MTKKDFTIAIDAMGGDYAPEEIVKGVILATEKYPNLKFLMFGLSEKIQPLLKTENENQDLSKIKVIHASEVIEMDEEPVKSIRSKKNSSLVLAAQAVKDGQADAFFSAGNTGAILAASIFVIGRIKGVSRPALLTTLPSVKDTSHPTVLMDVGANAESKPGYLYQFGILASFYAQHVLGYKKPIVKLLNNGGEEDKGDGVHKEAHQLLKNSDLNFQGNIEAREILQGASDVIVADGFSGNAALKATEGTALTIFGELKKLIKEGSLKTKIGGALIKPALKEFASILDYNKSGGAVIMGVNAPVVKTHGSAKALAVSNSIEQINTMLVSDLVKDVEKYVADNMETFQVKTEE